MIENPTGSQERKRPETKSRREKARRSAPPCGCNPVTAEDKVNKEGEVKAKAGLLQAEKGKPEGEAV